jgi:hypothetical protein
MANAIIANEFGFRKIKGSKIALATKEKEFSMARSLLLDTVTPAQRMSIPFRFHWLKFKTGFFGLTLKRGIIQ